MMFLTEVKITTRVKVTASKRNTTISWRIPINILTKAMFFQKIILNNRAFQQAIEQKFQLELRGDPQKQKII